MSTTCPLEDLRPPSPTALSPDPRPHHEPLNRLLVALKKAEPRYHYNCCCCYYYYDDYYYSYYSYYYDDDDDDYFCYYYYYYDDDDYYYYYDYHRTGDDDCSDCYYFQLPFTLCLVLYFAVEDPEDAGIEILGLKAL